MLGTRAPQELKLSGSKALLIEPAPENAIEITGALRGCGAQLTVLSTVPLAIRYLAERRSCVDVVVVGPSIDPLDGKALVTTLRESLHVSPMLLPAVLITQTDDRSAPSSSLPYLFEARVPNHADGRQLIGAIHRLILAGLQAPAE